MKVVSLVVSKMAESLAMWIRLQHRSPLRESCCAGTA
jgi:hypothetical protein